MKNWMKVLMGGTMTAGAMLGTAQAANDPLNAVVKVECTRTVPNYFLPWQMRTQPASSGSGVVIRGNRILTNAHNVAYQTMLTLRKQNDDAIYMAKVAFIDHQSDLALLTVDDPGFFANITPFELGETPRPQSQVVAIGFPLGGDGLSMTQGIISRIELLRYSHSGEYLLGAQIDAALNPGNSGGPVLHQGKVVGIAFQGNRAGENLGYMIPYEVIRHFLIDIQDGKVDGIGWIGFAPGPLENPDTRTFLRMAPGETGLMVRKTVAGMDPKLLQKGDVLLAIDGKRIANNGNIRLADGQPRSYLALLREKQIGESVRLTLLRQGKKIETSITLQKYPGLVADRLYDRIPEYYTIGGLVFTSLSRSFLDEWGKDTPPAELLRKLEETKKFPDEEVVVLCMVLSDEVNIGYQDLASLQLQEINGQKVRNLRDAIRKIEGCKEKYITFLLDDDVPVILDVNRLRAATPRILKNYRIPADRCLRLEGNTLKQDSK